MIFLGENYSDTGGTRHAELRCDKRMGFGYRPVFIPSYQVVLHTGIIAGMGGVAFESPIIAFNRRNPVSGNCTICVLL